MNRFIFLFLCCCPFFGEAQLITDALEQSMDSKGVNEIHRVLVVFNKPKENRLFHSKSWYQRNKNKDISYYLDSLHMYARMEHASVREYLDSVRSVNNQVKFETLWLANAMVLEAPRDVIRGLKNNEVIDYIDFDYKVVLDNVKEEVHPYRSSTQDGLKIIKADYLWSLGYTGKGSIVMNVDAGVKGDHPALQKNWRGNNGPWQHAWFDPIDSTTSPEGCVGHGTLTMGVLCGKDTVNKDTIGVAFDAEWIAAKAPFCTDSSYLSYVIQCFQWGLNPDGNTSTTSDMPVVISNSWTDNSVAFCSTLYETLFKNVEAMGVPVVFSVSNRGISGPGSPKNISINEVNTFTVGNIDGAEYLSGNLSPRYSTSSVGPSKCGGGGSLKIKPEVVAPGTKVYTSSLNGYTLATGTSLSSPHVSGVVALLRQAFPVLSGEEVKYGVYYSAVDLGPSGEDNEYGMGLINAEKAYNYLMEYTHMDVSVADVSIVSDTSCMDSVKMEVTILNNSNAYLRSIELTYILNGDTNVKSLSTMGSGVESRDSITLTFGSVEVKQGVNDLLVKLSFPNNHVDINPINDTLEVNFLNSCLTSLVSLDENTIVLFPNPSKGIINVSADYIEVLNNTGTVILKSSSKQLDLSEYSKGLYFIRARVGEQWGYSKVILE